MTAPTPTALLKQHLIDPVICIRCNTCEETCPVKAITHDSRNYVVDPDICNGCGACISPCPTGSIDNWRSVLRAEAYTLDAQLGWDELPTEMELSSDSSEAAEEPGFLPPPLDSARGSTIAPATAARPAINLHTIRNPATATVVGNFRVTATDSDSDTHHVVLDLGSSPFPVLEGQSIGIIPPGTDEHGRPHHARQYSIASPRDGERPKYNNLSLTVKRVLVDHDGQPVRGLASNYVCDLARGDQRLARPRDEAAADRARVQQGVQAGAHRGRGQAQLHRRAQAQRDRGGHRRSHSRSPWRARDRRPSDRRCGHGHGPTAGQQREGGE